MTPSDFTKPSPFGLNGTLGLVMNEYYWCRHPQDGTRFVAMFAQDGAWYITGNAYPQPVSRDQVICKVKAPEN